LTDEKEQGVVLPFLRHGLYALLSVGVLGALCALPGVSGALRFTAVTEAKLQLWILGAISFPLFGVLYACLPPLLGRECWSSALSSRHFWLMFSGLWLLVALMLFGGLFTGIALSDPTVSFLNITSYSYPFHVMECAAQLLLLAAAVILALNFSRALAWDYLTKHPRK
jgi:cbb3-type cytochrome oxidase subunit 1